MSLTATSCLHISSVTVRDQPAEEYLFQSPPETTGSQEISCGSVFAISWNSSPTAGGRCRTVFIIDACQPFHSFSNAGITNRENEYLKSLYFAHQGNHRYCNFPSGPVLYAGVFVVSGGVSTQLLQFYP